MYSEQSNQLPTIQAIYLSCVSILCCIFPVVVFGHLCSKAEKVLPRFAVNYNIGVLYIQCEQLARLIKLILFPGKSISNNNNRLTDPHTTTDELQSRLDWELRLPASDMRSCGWFHGTISRQQAEGLVRRDGEFLVRESQSQPGQQCGTMSV